MSARPNILFIDDDSDAALSLIQALKATGLPYALHAATSAEMGKRLQREIEPAVIVTDLTLDERVGPESGFALMRELSTAAPTARIIVLTGYGSVEHGVKALQLGAASFLEKPPDIDHLAALIRDGVNQSELKRQFLALEEQSRSAATTELIGSSDAAKKIRAQLAQAAQTSQPIFISGETGSGKGLCAQIIHRLSPRSARNFVRYQPSFATADLVASELFGHIRGAFTGASESRKGLIAEADHGTLFLDEIDELPPETQVSLLGVLQDKKFRAIGSNKEEQVNFRLISASNQDIDSCIESGKLRRDLYHRIAHSVIHLPALRERLEDIAPLAEHYLKRLRERERVNVFEIAEQTIQALKRYSWPGNIRQLEGAIESAAYSAQFGGRLVILPEDLNLQHENRTANGMAGSFQEQVESFKVKLIDEALSRSGNSQAKAAKELGLDRTSLRRILSRNR